MKKTSFIASTHHLYSSCSDLKYSYIYLYIYNNKRYIYFILSCSPVDRSGPIVIVNGLCMVHSPSVPCHETEAESFLGVTKFVFVWRKVGAWKLRYTCVHSS